MSEILILTDNPKSESESADDGRGARYIKKNILRPLKLEDEDIAFGFAVNQTTKKKPVKKDVMTGRPDLEALIHREKPKVIIAHGNAPLASLVGLDKVGGITSWRGMKLWSSEFGCWIVPTNDNASIQIDRSHGYEFRYDQTISDYKAAIECTFTDGPEFDMPDTPLVQDEDEAARILSTAAKTGFVALDLETAALDPREDILGLSITYKDDSGYHCYYIDWSVFDHAGKPAFLLEKILLSTKISKVLHNIAFDRKFLHFHGFPMDGPMHDTMVMCSLLDENFSKGLKENTWRYLPFGGYDMDLEKYKFEHKFTKNTSYSEIPIEIMTPYAAIDTLATHMLYETMVPMLHEDGLWPLYDKITMPTRNVMTEAEINGIYVNMEQVEILDAQMQEAKNVLEQQIYKVAGFEIQFSSTKQLGEYLYFTLKAPGAEYTKKNNLICNKESLAALAKKTKRKYGKIAALVLKWKYIDKLQGTYIGQARKFTWDTDGRVHSNYNMTGTVTGRTSNGRPCTHNIPKDRMIRSLYRASPGNVLVEADINAAEMRAIALESNDEVLLRIINSGGDIHNMTYNEMFHKPADYIPTQAERRIAKSINFGLIYGITPIGLARRLAISKEEAQAYVDAYFNRFRGVAKWIRDTVKFAREHGYVKSLFNRRRRLMDINNDDVFHRWRAERQAMNSPIQSAAADYTYIGLIRVAKMMKKAQLEAKIIHTVHDCIIIDTPPTEVEKIKAIVEKAFLTPVQAFPMKMDIDIEVTEKWGEHNDSNLEELLHEILFSEEAAA